RLEALEGLRQLGPAGRAALPEVLAQLGSDWPKLCRRAARAVLALLPAREGVLALLEATRTAGAPGQRAIATVLGEAGPLPPDVLPGLRALAEAPCPATRLEAVRFLGRLALSAQGGVAGPATDAVVAAVADPAPEIVALAWDILTRLVEE